MKLKEFIKENDMTEGAFIADCAGVCGIDSNTARRWLADDLDDTAFKNIAVILHVGESQVKDALKEREAPESAENYVVRLNIKELVDNFDSMSDIGMRVSAETARKIARFLGIEYSALMTLCRTCSVDPIVKQMALANDMENREADRKEKRLSHKKINERESRAEQKLSNLYDCEPDGFKAEIVRVLRLKGLSPKSPADLQRHLGVTKEFTKRLLMPDDCAAIAASMSKSMRNLAKFLGMSESAFHEFCVKAKKNG